LLPPWAATSLSGIATGHLGGELPDYLARPRTPQDIVRAAARKHGMSVTMLSSQRRFKDIVAARHEAIVNLYFQTTLSTPQIARHVGLKDHSSVLHAIKKARLAVTGKESEVT
jgi:chromosomal replication initiator protein